MKRCVVTTVILASVRLAAADQVTVMVTEIAGGVAYLDKGSKDGIQHGQKGWVLDDSGNPLPGGEVVIIIVRSGVSIAKTTLKRSVVDKNRRG